LKKIIVIAILLMTSQAMATTDIWIGAGTGSCGTKETFTNQMHAIFPDAGDMTVPSTDFYRETVNGRYIRYMGRYEHTNDAGGSSKPANYWNGNSFIGYTGQHSEGGWY